MAEERVTLRANRMNRMGRMGRMGRSALAAAGITDTVRTSANT
jgi:hypothetical protein